MVDHAPPLALVPLPPRDHRARRRYLALAALVAGVAVAALVAVMVWPGRGGGGKTPPAGAAATMPAAPLPRPGRAAATPDVTVPTSAPAGITWASFVGYVLPYSSAAGPTRFAGPVVAGYADTPTGALVAGLQITLRAGFTPSPGWRAVVAEQVMPGKARDLFVTLRGQSDGAAPAGSFSQVAGFRFDGYSPSLAVITYAMADQNGSYHPLPATLAWSQGDWRLVLPAGLAEPAPTTLADLTGFVSWSGVN